VLKVSIYALGLAISFLVLTKIISAFYQYQPHAAVPVLHLAYVSQYF
jgi:hypothetical protein